MYAALIEADLKEVYNKTVDYIEYLASFSNPSGVEELRKRRNTVQKSTVQDQKIFDDMVSKLFGREVSVE